MVVLLFFKNEKTDKFSKQGSTKFMFFSSETCYAR
jgi:hypothetical protein